MTARIRERLRDDARTDDYTDARTAPSGERRTSSCSRQPGWSARESQRGFTVTWDTGVARLGVGVDTTGTVRAAYVCTATARSIGELVLARPDRTR